MDQSQCPSIVHESSTILFLIRYDAIAGIRLPFIAIRQDDFQEEDALREYIQFKTQLTHGINVFLVVKENNPGVKFHYVLPPMQKPHASPTEAKNMTRHNSADGTAKETAGVISQEDRLTGHMAQGVGNSIFIHILYNEKVW